MVIVMAVVNSIPAVLVASNVVIFVTSKVLAICLNHAIDAGRTFAKLAATHPTLVPGDVYFVKHVGKWRFALFVTSRFVIDVSNRVHANHVANDSAASHSVRQKGRSVTSVKARIALIAKTWNLAVVVESNFARITIVWWTARFVMCAIVVLVAIGINVRYARHRATKDVSARRKVQPRRHDFRSLVPTDCVCGKPTISTVEQATNEVSFVPVTCSNVIMTYVVSYYHYSSLFDVSLYSLCRLLASTFFVTCRIT